MAEERPVEATDEALLVGSYKQVLPAAEGEVMGGAERVLAGVVDHVLADGAEGDAPGDLVGSDMIALDLKEVSELLLLLCGDCGRPCNSFSASMAS